MTIHRTMKKNLTYGLYIFGMVMYAVIFLLGISNMAETKRNTEAIKQTTSSTNKLVSGQNQILTAIKKVTLDTNLTAGQQTKIIICMLQVRQAERTTDTETNCRKQASVTETGATGDSSGVSGIQNTQSSQSSNATTNAAPSQAATPETIQSTPQPTPPSVLERLTAPITNLLNRIF